MTRTHKKNALQTQVDSTRRILVATGLPVSDVLDTETNTVNYMYT